MPFLVPVALAGESAATVSTFVTEIGTFFTAAIGWLTQVGQTIIGDPILLTFCAVPLVGLAIGIYRRLMNVN